MAPLFFRLAAALAACALLGACGGRGTPQPGSEQTIVNIGSDTMVNLALAWAEAYQAEHPAISVSVTGGGSGTGLAALLNGTVDIANASRPISAQERANLEASGIVRVEFVVARDAIAIIVHPDNPVSALSLPQLSAIYQGQITNWDLTFAWDPAHVLLVLGASYIGHMDDLAVFNRDLSDAEVKQVYELKRGVGELHEAAVK